MKKNSKIGMALLVLCMLWQSALPIWAAEMPRLTVEIEKLSDNKIQMGILLEDIPQEVKALEVSFVGNNLVKVTEEKWEETLATADKTINLINKDEKNQQANIYIVGKKGENLEIQNQSIYVGDFILETSGTSGIRSNSGYMKLIDEKNNPLTYEDLKVKIIKENDGNNGENSGGNTEGDTDTEEESSKPENKPEDGKTNVEFIDITGHWAEKSIVRMAEMGYVGGYQDKTYRPNANITRAEFSAILTRIFSFNPMGPMISPFTDVKAGDWYVEPVLLLYQNGITSGRGETFFGSNSMITNEEIAALIARTLRAKGITLSKVREYKPFVDQAQISSFAVNDVKYLYEAGMISGLPGNQYAPKAFATRAQVVTIFDRLLITIENQE